jgi:hypothetical protein
MTFIKTFDEFDKLGLSSFRDQFLSFLHTEKDWVEGALVVSLEAPFGSGKSTFFEMLNNWLTANINPANPQIPIPVYLNAWVDDHSGEPILAMASQLSSALKKYLDEDGNSSLKKMRALAGMVGKAAMAIANDVVRETCKVDIERAVNKLNLEKAGNASIEAFEQSKNYLTELKRSIAEVVTNTKLQILVLVDELDRCRPDYAIDYLESIKHLFNQQGMTFVLGIDRAQMAASTKCLFGNELNFDEYFRKFSHRRIKHPNLNAANSESFCVHLLEKYLLQKEIQERKCFIKFESSAQVHTVTDVLLGLKLTARQSHEVMRIVAHATAITEDKNPNMFWGWAVATIVLSSLSVVKPDLYHRFSNGGIPESELAALCVELTSAKGYNSRKEWWANILFLANSSNVDISIDDYRSYRRLIFPGVPPADGQLRDGLEAHKALFTNYFGDFKAKIFLEIYEVIENLRRFHS